MNHSLELLQDLKERKNTEKREKQLNYTKEKKPTLKLSFSLCSASTRYYNSTGGLWETRRRHAFDAWLHRTATKMQPTRRFHSHTVAPHAAPKCAAKGCILIPVQPIGLWFSAPRNDRLGFKVLRFLLYSKNPQINVSFGLLLHFMSWT